MPTFTSSAVSQLALERLVVRDLRNLDLVELEPAGRLNVLAGSNGQGKTSLLEAIYLLATSRSFRTAKLGELVRHGAPHAVCRGTFLEQAPDGYQSRREQSCGVELGKRLLRVDGESPPSASLYATRSPVVVFDPQQMALTTGPASGRRILLDRTCLFLSPSYPTEIGCYRRALESRQALLASRVAPAHAERAELDAFEALMGRHGAAVSRARVLAAEELGRRTNEAFAAFGASGQRVAVRYRPGGSTDPEVAVAELAAGRSTDARRHRAGFGPHLDELELELDGYPLRRVGSQGQHRAVTLALKIAELGCIANARGLEPILLLDDVSSELDEERADALFRHLATTRNQIFLTTTRPALILASGLDGADRRDFEVTGGVIRSR